MDCRSRWRMERFETAIDYRNYSGSGLLGLCFIGGLWYHLLILAMALVGYYEFVRMTHTAPFGGTAWIGYAGVLLLVFPWGPLDLKLPIPWEHVLWLLLLLFLLATVTTKNTIDIKRISLLFLASVYIGIGFSFIAESRHAPDGHGVFWTFCCWARSGQVMRERILSAAPWGAINYGLP